MKIMNPGKVIAFRQPKELNLVDEARRRKTNVNKLCQAAIQFYLSENTEKSA